MPPLQVFAEADPTTSRSRLFQYYLLDSTGFQPSVFTTTIAGVNDDPSTQQTVWGANCDCATIGSVRLALEPKPGLPTDPDDARAFIDIFTDIRGLFVINNESGWYEGWMIHDLRVAAGRAARHDGPRAVRHDHRRGRRAARRDGHRQQRAGPHLHRRRQGAARAEPERSLPGQVTNVVSLQLSMGAYNALQQTDAHSYWEFNYTTNWIHPLYELPFTGGFPDSSRPSRRHLRTARSACCQSIVPGNEPGENQPPPGRRASATTPTTRAIRTSSTAED